MTNKNILLLDGIADYSIIYKHKINAPNNYLLILGNIIKKTFLFEVEFVNGQEARFNNSYLESVVAMKPPHIIIIASYIYNIENIKNIIKKLNLKNVLLFIDDPCLKEVLAQHKEDMYGFVFYDESKTFNENYSIIINQIFPSVTNYSFEYDYQYWDLVNLNKISNVNIVIGSGCKRGCKFCNISDTPIYINNLSNVLNEIKYLVSRGIKFFHIRNHNLAHDNRFFKELCLLIKKDLSFYDFSWSCSLLPDGITNGELLSLLKDAKVEKIEFELYHSSLQILSKYGINTNLDNFKNIISQLYKQEITSICINYLIGSPFETQNTLNEIIKYSKDLISIAPGTVEFKIKVLSRQIKNSYNNNSLNSFAAKTAKEISLTEQDLQEFINRFNKICFNEFANSLKRTNICQRTLHIKLAEKGICTLYYLYFISKSAVFNVYKVRAANPTLKYSWEIKDNILNYTPLIFSKYAYLNSSRVIFINKQYTDKQYILLNDYRFNMYNLAKEYKSIYDIIEVIKERFPQYSEDQNKLHVFDFFLELEQADMTLFLKCIN